MRSRFLARCMSLCFACMMALQVSGTLLFLSQPLTAYAYSSSTVLMVTAFQIRRPDPSNSHNTHHITVLSVKVSYTELSKSGINTTQTHDCLKTPGQAFYTFTSPNAFAWGTTVNLDLYTSSDCTGSNANASVYPEYNSSAPFTSLIPVEGQVVKSTCWVDLNVYPNGHGGGCNDGSSHP